MLDGKAFLPKGYLPTGNLVCNYIDGKDFTVNLAQKLNNQTILIGIISNNQSLVVGQTYILKEYGANSQFGEYNIYQNIGDLRYKTTSTITGELKITNHNFNKAIPSGTFWFDAINSEWGKIQVRDGRFDREY